MFASRPVIAGEHAGASPDGSPLERRLVKLEVSNKGPMTPSGIAPHRAAYELMRMG